LQSGGQDWLHLHSNEITRGYSGAPIWDGLNHIVLGMITAINDKDENDRLGAVAYATPSETLQRIFPDLVFSNGDADIQGVIREYRDEVLNDYTSYWRHFVKQTPDELGDSHSHRPVGQAFVLSESKIQISSNSDSSSQIKESSSSISSSNLTTQLVFPSLFSVFNALVLEQHRGLQF
jgi:hypothetical protein